MSYPPNYGQQNPYQPYGAPPPIKNNGLAIASLVLGLTGFITCGFTSLLAVVFGHVALGQIRRDRTDGRGMALAGVMLGWSLTGLWILYWVLVMAGAVSSFGSLAAGRDDSASSEAAGAHTVVLEAVGSDGATSAMNITSSVGYDVKQDSGVPLPWRKELKLNELGHTYLWVQNAGDKGTVTCRIIIDGKVTREKVEKTPYGICQVTADTP
ncbi:DUF4190 domain-containing protein [Streptosporangium saharense]|uniref:DUF4190 domain-containing protein n=1 Tax=Streptosporangium saharense TaxID=1706840 RepID=UPI003440F939